MRAAIGFGLAFAFVLPTTSVQAQGVSKLNGTYKLISGKRGDKAVPKDHLDGIVRIMADTMTIYDKDNQEVYVISYKIDREGDPHRLSMTVTRATRSEAVGSKARGLIKVDGDKAMIIYDYKGEDYPSDFEPKGDSQHLFVMERTTEK